jgi:hypothetical protein
VKVRNVNCRTCSGAGVVDLSLKCATFFILQSAKQPIVIGDAGGGPFQIKKIEISPYTTQYTHNFKLIKRPILVLVKYGIIIFLVIMKCEIISICIQTILIGVLF